MKKCIWCLKTEPEISYKKRAHIIPQSLGSKLIFENECDFCNSYFGRAIKNGPSIDLAVKEAFNITRHFLIEGFKKDVPKFRSEYFKVDTNKKKWSLRPRFQLKKNFQTNLCKQLKRGLYKISLEYLYLETKLGYENEFDIIRDFVRYNNKNLPVYYLQRKHGAVLTSEEMLRKPFLLLTNDWKENVFRFKCFEFELLHHKFMVPLSSDYDKEYFKKERLKNEKLFFKPLPIQKFTDIDFSLKVFDPRTPQWFSQ